MISKSFFTKSSVRCFSRPSSKPRPYDLIPPVRLQDGDVVLLLVLTDLFRDVHPLGHDVQHFMIDLVDLFAQFLQLRPRQHVVDLLMTEDEMFEQFSHLHGGQLLFGVAEGFFRVDV